MEKGKSQMSSIFIGSVAWLYHYCKANAPVIGLGIFQRLPCMYYILCTLYSTLIDKLYTQIGNVNSLHNKIEPFAALF